MSNYNTEKLRSLIDAQGGLASPNRYMVLLPTIFGLEFVSNKAALELALVGLAFFS